MENMTYKLTDFEGPLDLLLTLIEKNKYNILDVLREYIHQLEIFRKALEKDNRDDIRQTIERANTIRKILDKAE